MLSPQPLLSGLGSWCANRLSAAAPFEVGCGQQCLVDRVDRVEKVVEAYRDLVVADERDTRFPIGRGYTVENERDLGEFVVLFKGSLVVGVTRQPFENPIQLPPRSPAGEVVVYFDSEAE